ncbi:YppG family protein [Bacillus solimangrovi]|uniref:Spore coat protein n=1 Tax=Bacillus solimangrovi TaxID=1305675 RepID=A0A1E5LEF5_9BACI|nr:YppG family protein [Bacillus solimangrovi]OEH92452.1 hypothetical protein BFG57_15845 [Bacillus solimangrovi]
MNNYRPQHYYESQQPTQSYRSYPTSYYEYPPKQYATQEQWAQTEPTQPYWGMNTNGWQQSMPHMPQQPVQYHPYMHPGHGMYVPRPPRYNLMTFFQNDDGKFDMNKTMSTMNQITTTVKQVSPLVKTAGPLLSKLAGVR